MAFTPMDYMNANKDVWNAYNTNNQGMTMNAFAQKHYQDFGKNEGRQWGQPKAQPKTTDSNPYQGPDIFQPNLYQRSRSGLPQEYQTQLLGSLMPMLLGSIEGYEGNIDASTQAAQELFESQTRRGMKDSLKGILNSMAGRNMLNSSVASDSIAKGMGDIVQAGAQKGYETSMNNAALKAQLPAMLANIAQLGQSSTSENPLEPYKLLAQYDWNLM